MLKQMKVPQLFNWGTFICREQKLGYDKNELNLFWSGHVVGGSRLVRGDNRYRISSIKCLPRILYPTGTLTIKYPMKVASYYFHVKKHVKISTEAYEKDLNMV